MNDRIPATDAPDDGTREVPHSGDASAVSSTDGGFKALVENSPDLIARFGRDLRRLYVNPAIERRTGVPASELVGTSLRDRNFDERFVDQLEDALSEAFKSGSERSLDVILPGPEGEGVFQARIVPEFGPDGQVVSALCISRDITSLHRSEQRMRELVATAHDAIITLDLEGVILEVNPALVRMLGTPAEEIIGRVITEFIRPDFLKPLAEALRRATAPGQVATIIAPVRTADGRYVNLEATASRQRGADAMFVIARDVTERLQAEAERHALTAEIELLLASTYEGICAADASGRCTLVNESAATMLGYSRSELMGKKLHELIHDRQADGSPNPAEDCPMMLATKNGTPAHVAGDVFWRKDGTSFPVELFVSPILNDDGTIRGIVTSFIDVTERQYLRLELDRANRMAALGRVATTMSHEFNNVLMGIQPFAEALARFSQDARVLGAANRIIDAVRRGSHITEDLRAFTHPSPPKRTRIDLQAWLREFAETIRRQMPSSVHVETAIVEAPIEVDADRDHLTQVLTDLVFNARDAFDGKQGTIRLSLDGAGSDAAGSPGTAFARISIADDGPGIAQENLERVFEPFFTTKRSGTGLGLAIAQQLVSMQGGRVTIERGDEGRGTTVHVLLPLAQPLQLPTPDSSTSTGDRRQWPTEILLTEDDEAVAMGVIELLKDEQRNVRLAINGSQTMKILEGWKPEALVIDVNLPDCNGFDLYEQITASFGPLPVVFASGHADSTRLEKLKNVTRAHLLTKPYAIETLLEVLASLNEGSA